MPGRAARDCRDRWHCYLSDFNKNDPWTPEEDALLLEKLGQYGPRWVRIAKDVPNRSDLAIKRRWSTIFER
jgi:myb proto-oncogene protein